jgi:hypothetical protein
LSVLYNGATAFYISIIVRRFWFAHYWKQWLAGPRPLPVAIVRCLKIGGDAAPLYEMNQPIENIFDFLECFEKTNDWHTTQLFNKG